MIKKILIANRGEIACRVIKTAKRMNILTVAVYSTADANALHMKMADEAVDIGPAPSNESYLVIEKIIAAAKKTGADAIHPGYGFLSENVDFRVACDKHGIIFIGPSASAIQSMGSKSAAKTIMGKADVPLVPGYHGDDQHIDILKAKAEEIGYPVLLKASAGGGGKGMRQVYSSKEFDEALDSAKRESLKSFNDDKMLVEKYLTKPRHVEVQVFCDLHGNAVYLADRDCSIQRRHQKVIEEAPAPNIEYQIRQLMGEAAIRAAKAIQYSGAGTVEFLLDEDNTFYFMEMNTRLQVEHPVTEMVTGIDLVEWQIHVANNEQLPLTQSQVKTKGHAFEARIYAEDPANDFLPSSGNLAVFSLPSSDDVRVDTGVVQGDDVSVFYDPMIAKLVVWGEHRSSALSALGKVLSQCKIDGLETNLSFLYNLACHPAFYAEQLETVFIEKHQESIFKTSPQDLLKTLVLQVVSLVLQTQQKSGCKDDSPWKSVNSWRMNQNNKQLVPLFISNNMYEVYIDQCITHHFCQLSFENTQLESEPINIRKANLVDGKLIVELGHPLNKSMSAIISKTDKANYFYTDEGVYISQNYQLSSVEEEQAAGHINAALHGTIVTLLVEENQPVSKDDPLLVMEAMKMEHTIKAPDDGVVKSFFFQPGDMVESGKQLLDFEPLN